MLKYMNEKKKLSHFKLPLFYCIFNNISTHNYFLDHHLNKLRCLMSKTLYQRLLKYFFFLKLLGKRPVKHKVSWNVTESRMSKYSFLKKKFHIRLFFLAKYSVSAISKTNTKIFKKGKCCFLFKGIQKLLPKFFSSRNVGVSRYRKCE